MSEANAGEGGARAKAARQKVAALLAPRNVVIAGASDRGHSWSRSVFRNLKKYEFPGAVYPLNPARAEVWGEVCYPDFAALPQTPDHVVVLVPARDVVSILEQAAAAGARSATVFTAGFEEGEGENSKARAKALREIISRTGLAVSGPNCLGNLAAKSRLMTMTDSRAHDMRPGPVAIVSQSGGVGTAIKRTFNDRGVGVGYLLTTGNQAGLTVADYIEFFACEPDVRVIVCYLEALHAPRDFLAACAAARAAGKPVVVVKLGGSREGRAAALAHTGALAGAFEAFDAVAGAAGAIRVRTLDDAIETAEFFLHASLPQGAGLGAITFSGGLRGLLIDAAAANGVDFPELAPATQAKLAKLLGVGTIVGNPLDAGFAALSSPENYLETIRVMQADPGIGTILLQEEISRESGIPKEANLHAVNAMVAAGELTKPVAFCSMISYHFTPYSRALRGRLPNTPFLQEPDKTLRALRAVIDYAAAARQASRRAPHAQAIAPTPAILAALDARTATRALNEAASKTFLRDCGIPAPAEIVAATPEAALRAAAEIGFPVALKIVSADIFHKSDVGGVKLDLRSPDDVRAAYGAIVESVARRMPAAKIEGVLVAPFIGGGLEFALGVKNDPDVGCVVMVGAGGVLLELVEDVAFGPPGLDARAANDMIARTRVGRLLDGYRGSPPADRQALVAALVALGRLAAQFNDEIEAIDINPFVVLERGKGGFALDGLVVLRGPRDP